MRCLAMHVLIGMVDRRIALTGFQLNHYNHRSSLVISMQASFSAAQDISDVCAQALQSFMKHCMLICS